GFLLLILTRPKWLRVFKYLGPNIEKLPYGATGSFCCPDRGFQRCCGTNFTEKDARDLRKEASVVRVLIERHPSNFSHKRLLRQSLLNWHSMTASLVSGQAARTARNAMVAATTAPQARHWRSAAVAEAANERAVLACRPLEPVW